jgi:hypothetical protein
MPIWQKWCATTATGQGIIQIISLTLIRGLTRRLLGAHTKSRTYALRVKAAPEEQGTERGDGATAEALDEQDTPELQEPSSSEDDEQFEEGSEEDVFILEDWEEGEEPPLEPEETLNAMQIEGEGDENGESCHIAAVHPTVYGRRKFPLPKPGCTKRR